MLKVLHVPCFKGTGWKLNPSFQDSIAEGLGLKSRTGASSSSLVCVLLHTAPEEMIWGFCCCDWSAAAELGGLIQCWVYRAANEICWGKTLPTAAAHGSGITASEYCNRADPSASHKKQWNITDFSSSRLGLKLKYGQRMENEQDWKKTNSVVVLAVNIYLLLLVNIIEEHFPMLYLVQKLFFFMSKYLPVT